ncbi:hypothetical protein M8818_001416 [Zalaria obscura]|uniref:Uncharacterized protein n=1 Tax=Zalaria obscura TaxID=2024903 RepID=A0ACC3SK91_9PEZI
MRTQWQLLALAASGAAAEKYAHQARSWDSSSSIWASDSLSYLPTGGSSSQSTPLSSLSSSQAPYYANTSTVVSSTSYSTAPESQSYTTVTDVLTYYTTVCPATSYVTSGEVTSTVTYVSTSVLTATAAGTSGLSSTSETTATSAPVSEASVTAIPVTTLSASSSAPASTSPGLDQVGNSTWGTTGTGCFPKWLPRGDGTPYNLAPWGNKTTTNSDATIRSDVPYTGVTRYYDFTISRGRISPDGVLRDVILINGQYPGPLIEANWGDWIQVTVHNEIYFPDEGTSLHWHGMLQRDTQWYDGVPAVGQCPIAPGHNFTYKYQAELYGTSWYHAHYSAQYTAGVVGPMVVYGPTQEDYDCDVGPIMLSDWYHIPYFSITTFQLLHTPRTS